MVVVGVLASVAMAQGGRVVVGVVEDGRRVAIVGEEARVSADGLSMRVQPSGELEVIPWFEVVEMQSTINPDAALYRVPDAWRGAYERSRVGAVRAGNGDLRGAAASVRALARELLGSSSRQARWVFRVLLEDAALRGDTMDSCVAMLALRLSGERGGFDARHELHPDAPMVRGVEGGGALFELLRDHERWDEEARAIIALRAVIEDGEGFERANELAARAGGGLGMELCERMVAAQADPDPVARAAARDWLRSRASSMDSTWIDAWARISLASSLAIEGDEESVSRAMIELSHVVVRFADDPALSVVAITMARRIGREHERFEALAALERAYHGSLISRAPSAGTD
jgi:hypothetical protein